VRFRPYPKYKASGVDWLGDVPEGWTCSRLRYFAELNPSKSETIHLSRDTEVSFLPMEAIGEDGSIKLDREKPISEVESGYTYFRDGDITIAKITPCFENGKGALMAGLSNGIGFGTTELIVIRPNGNTHERFLQWVFQSTPFRKLGEGFMYGAGGQKRVPDDFVRNFCMAWPSYLDQTFIAAFLDRETAKIDTLIAKQEKLIQVLKEKRQAMISHAVTKGLDPNVQMKPSGIEWLADVPEHWSVSRMATLFSEVSESGPDELPILSVSIHTGVSDKELDDSEMDRMVTRSDDKSKYKRVRPGDLVYNMMRAWQGGFGTVTVEGLVSPAYVVARPKNPLITAYLEGLLRTPQAIEQMRRYSQGVTDFRLRLYWGEFKNIYIALPPLDEAIKIMKHIGTETCKINALIAKAEQAIVLQKEHRTALISAVVTGKIDVRNEVAERKAA